MNDINFPAGVLQPPLFDPLADDAANFGQTGATIGHELTHRFDVEGRQFDGQGNLRDWWTAGDAKEFEKRTACVSKARREKARMGEMQSTLAILLRSVGAVTAKTLPSPTKRDIAVAGLESQFEDVYRALGGKLPSFAFKRVGSWDLEFDGIAVELDEQLHFNRYRGVTLDSPCYEQLLSFPLDAYRRYCSEYEDACLKAGGYGGKWSNASCETLFGAASPAGDISGGGAPRWKQRAVYDFIKDLSHWLVGVSVVRIAIWDTVKEGTTARTVGQILTAPSDSSAVALAALIGERADRLKTRAGGN